MFFKDKNVIHFFDRDIKNGQMLVKLIVSLDRGQGKGSASETVDVAIAAHHQNPKIVVGLDLSGDPMKGLVADYLPILARGRNAGLKISIHCAEVCICSHSLTSEEAI
jgi:adenosine deaminase